MKKVCSATSVETMSKWGRRSKDRQEEPISNSISTIGNEELRLMVTEGRPETRTSHGFVLANVRHSQLGEKATTRKALAETIG